jgi:hypothetical protein
MKKLPSLFFISFMAISLAACTSPQSPQTPQEKPGTGEHISKQGQPGGGEEKPEDKVRPGDRKDGPGKTEEKENPLQYDQMVLARLNEPFQLKVGQSAQLEGGKFTMTAKKVTEDSRCPSGGMVMCYWSGQVMVLLEISEGKDLPTSLQVSSIKPTTYNDLAITLTKVDPEKIAKMKHEGGGIEDTPPISQADYTFYFEIKNASDLPQEQKPQKAVPTESYKEKTLKEAKLFLPHNGVAFFMDKTEKNHRMMINFDTSELSYAMTSNSSPFYDNPHMKGYRVKITADDLKAMQQLSDKVSSSILWDYEDEKNVQVVAIVVTDGEAELYSSSKELKDDLKRLYDFMYNFTVIDKADPATFINF